MASIKMSVNVISDLFSLCAVSCDALDCSYHQPDTIYCDRKRICVSASGGCVNFKVKDDINQKEEDELSTD